MNFINHQWGTAYRLVVLIALAGIFSMLCIKESKVNGRLDSAPNYDDCGYFYDGALLLNKVKTHGGAGFLEFLNERGLHSPYSVFLAAGSYAVFGPYEPSPYYGNAILVFLYLAMIGWMLRGLRFGDWILLLAFFLAVPFITMGVVEFRPDIAWAVITGFGVVLIITSDRIFRHLPFAAVSGGLFALGLLIKPATFVMTTLLFGGSVVSRVVGYYLNRNQGTTRKSVLPGVSVFVGVLLLVAGPYWFRFGHDAWQYFWENSFGVNKQIWIYKGSNLESLMFYITGEGYRSNIRYAGMILLMLSIPCAIFLLVRKREYRWRVMMLLCAIGATLFVNTVATMKSPFLGGGIYGVWIFGSAFVINETYGALFKDGKLWSTYKRWASLLFLVCLGAALLLYRWPDYSHWGGDNQRRSDNYRLANDHMKHLLDQHQRDLPKNILFTQMEPIVWEDTGLWFAFHNIPVGLTPVAFFRTSKEFKDLYRNYEWIVVQEQEVMGCAENMPSEALLPELFTIVSSDPDYKRISEFTSLNGKKVWIYSRK